MEEMLHKIADYTERCAEVSARFAAEADADSEELDDWGA